MAKNISLNLYCLKDNLILKDSRLCLECKSKSKTIFKDKGYISCPQIRIAENLRFNTVMPIEIRPIIPEEVLPEKSVTKILLVRKGGGLGDIISTTVVTRGIKEKYPDSILTYYCADKYKDILEGNPYIDKIITKIEKKEWLEDYTLVIELDNPCPCYIYEVQNIKDKKTIFIPRNDLFCQRAGVNPIDKLPFIKIDKDSDIWIDQFFKDNKIKNTKIAIAPTSFEAMKSWPIENVKKLVELINSNLDSTVFILHENPIIIDKTIGFFTYPLKKVIALVNKMDLIVSVDTGFIHMAGALRRPLIGLFGVNEPVRVMAYYQAISYIYKKEALTCSPCYYLHSCHTFPSPCMQAITAEDVFVEIKKRLFDKNP